MLGQSEKETQSELTLLLEDFPVRTCPLQESGRDLLESGVDYGSSLLGLLTNLSRGGWLSKMSPVFYPVIEDRILPLSFDGWSNAGMAFAGGYLTLSISEFPKDGDACSLSEVLEVDVAQKYYLSAKVASGILRRAEKRGKALPPQLYEALVMVGKDSTTTQTP
jgi:hypothetical protein